MTQPRFAVIEQQMLLQQGGLPSSCKEGGIGCLLEGLEALVRLIHLNNIHLLANAGLHHVDIQQVELVELLDQVVVQRVGVCSNKQSNCVQGRGLQSCTR